MEVQLSVIIINYNGFVFLKDCLDSLQDKLQSISYEIIIFDNNSKDESCSFIKKNYTEVNLIESKVNFGFGKGNNEAVKQAKGKYLLLFNNDTILLDRVDSLITLLEEDKKAGVVGINMLNKYEEYIPAAGNFPNARNMFQFKKLLDLGLEFKLGKFTKEQYEVDWLGGSFLFLKKETYINVCGFDEDYFMYVEDVDFCKKIANIGLKRIFVPSLNYIHYVGFNKKKNPKLVEGYRIYLKKHKKGFEFVLLFFLLRINSIVKKIKLTLCID
jgi:GT2 family glycosyltransferase